MQRNILVVMISIIACILVSESWSTASSVQGDKNQSPQHHHGHHAVDTTTTTMLRAKEETKIPSLKRKALKLLVCVYALNNYGGYVKDSFDNSLTSNNLPSTNEFKDSMVDTMKEHASTLKANLAEHVLGEKAIKQFNKGIESGKKIQEKVKAGYMQSVHPRVEKKYVELKPVVEDYVERLKQQGRSNYEKQLKPAAQQSVDYLRTKTTSIMKAETMLSIVKSVKSCYIDLSSKVDQSILEKGREVGLDFLTLELVRDIREFTFKKYITVELVERFMGNLGFNYFEAIALFDIINRFMDNENITLADIINRLFMKNENE